MKLLQCSCGIIICQSFFPIHKESKEKKILMKIIILYIIKTKIIFVLSITKYLQAFVINAKKILAINVKGNIINTELKYLEKYAQMKFLFKK